MKENPYRAPTEPQEPPPVRGWSTSDRFWLLMYAGLVGGMIGGSLRDKDEIGPLPTLMPGVYGIIIGLAVAVVVLLVADIRRKWRP
jgi:hypothetical protein